jgi:hypothetical protein
MAPPGILPRLLPIVHGPLDRAGPLEVDGEQGRNLPHPRGISHLQSRANVLVQLHPPRRPYLLIQDLLVQGMLKAVAAPAGAIRPDRPPGVVEEVPLCRQGFTHRRHVLHGVLDPRRHRRPPPARGDSCGPRTQRQRAGASHSQA